MNIPLVCMLTYGNYNKSILSQTYADVHIIHNYARPVTSNIIKSKTYTAGYTWYVIRFRLKVIQGK